MLKKRIKSLAPAAVRKAGANTDDVTVQQIVGPGKITRRTLNRWIVAGLVPKPRVVAVKAGRGRRGVWDWWVPARVRRIKELHGRGIALEKIVTVLEQEIVSASVALAEQANPIVDRWFQPGAVDSLLAKLNPSDRKRVRGKGVRPVDLYESIVFGIAEHHGFGTRQARTIARAAAGRDMVSAAVTMYQGKMLPVLLWDGEAQKASVVPDFCVSAMFGAGYLLGRAGDTSKFLLVVALPLWEVVGLITSEGRKGHTTDPVMFPAWKVMEVRDGSGPMEYRIIFRRTGQHLFDFNVEVHRHTGTPVTLSKPMGPETERK